VSGRNHGFTLLEVLLAMSVLGVVVAMLSLSLSSSLQVVEATEREEEVFFQAQTALRRITADLGSAVAVQEGMFVGENKEIDGRRADQLTFSSQAHLVFNPEKQQPGVAIIAYRLQPDADDGRNLQLLRSDVLLAPGSAKDGDERAEPVFLLADNLRSVQFTFFDRQGQEFDSWQRETEANDLDTTMELPAAVHCILEFWLDRDKETVQTFSTRILLPAEAPRAD